MDWKELRVRLVRDPEVRRHYEELAPAYQLVAAMVERRRRLGITQEDPAKRMGTSQSVVSTLESGGGSSTRLYGLWSGWRACWTARFRYASFRRPETRASGITTGLPRSGRDQNRPPQAPSFSSGEVQPSRGAPRQERHTILVTAARPRGLPCLHSTTVTTSSHGR